MTYPARSTSDLVATQKGAFRRFLPDTDATIDENVLAIDAISFALGMKEADLRAAWIYDQIFARTADEYHLTQQHAPDLGLSRKSGGFSFGSLNLTGTPNASIPKGLRFLSGGVTYLSTADVDLDGSGLGTVTVRSLVTGSTTNRKEGEGLALADPGFTPSLTPSAKVASGGISGGSDRENVEVLRERVLERKANPPQGGAFPDLERWATEETYVSRAWARRKLNSSGAGVLYFLDAEGAIPEQPLVASLKEALEARRLIGLRDLSVETITDEPLTVEYTLIPNDVQLQTRVEENIKRAVAARARPGLPDEPFVLSRSWISEAISDTVGEASHVLTAPSSDVTYTLGKMPMTVTVTAA